MPDQTPATTYRRPPAPLRPGRPLVYRRRPGAWAFECSCAEHSANGQSRSAEPNHDSHSSALRAALRHVRYWHRDPLEVLFEVPAFTAGGPS